MPWEPERIEGIAQSLEDHARWVIWRAAVIAGLFFLFGLGGIAGGVDLNGAVRSFSTYIGGALWGLALYIAVKAQAEAARLRAEAQFVRLGIVLEENTRRTAEALELMVRHLGNTASR
jgi:hypothetical protein